MTTLVGKAPASLLSTILRRKAKTTPDTFFERRRQWSDVILAMCPSARAAVYEVKVGAVVIGQTRAAASVTLSSMQGPFVVCGATSVDEPETFTGRLMISAAGRRIVDVGPRVSSSAVFFSADCEWPLPITIDKASRVEVLWNPIDALTSNEDPGFLGRLGGFHVSEGDAARLRALLGGDVFVRCMETTTVGGTTNLSRVSFSPERNRSIVRYMTFGVYGSALNGTFNVDDGGGVQISFPRGDDYTPERLRGLESLTDIGDALVPQGLILRADRPLPRTSDMPTQVQRDGDLAGAHTNSLATILWGVQA